MTIPVPIKSINLESRVYALIVKTQSGDILHLGVHFTLEEAYSEACNEVEKLSTYKKGDHVSLDLWNSMPARKMIALIQEGHEKMPEFIPAPTEQKKDIIDLMGNMTPMPLEDFMKILKNNRPDPRKFVLDDYIEFMKMSKNDLIRELIEAGDLEKVEKIKDLLGANSKKYIIGEINKRNEKNKTTETPPPEDVQGQTPRDLENPH